MAQQAAWASIPCHRSHGGDVQGPRGCNTTMSLCYRWETPSLGIHHIYSEEKESLHFEPICPHYPGSTIEILRQYYLIYTLIQFFSLSNNVEINGWHIIPTIRLLSGNIIPRNSMSREQSGPFLPDIPYKNVQRCLGPRKNCFLHQFTHYPYMSGLLANFHKSMSVN